MDILYLGPEKTFSEQATIKLLSNLNIEGNLKSMANFEIVARSVSDNVDSIGVLPYYNYLEGLVQETLDLIYENNLLIEYCVRLPIAFSLGGLDIEYNDEPIYSHPKALAQCSEFIQNRFKDAKINPVSSTSEAARLVKEKGQGIAIASRDALKENNLIIIEENIGNRRHGRSNFTDFLLVTSKPYLKIEKSHDWRTMIAITPHMDRIGLLADILRLLAFFDLNIAKIHSRPAIDSVKIDIEPQMFYLEIMCSPTSEDLKRCIDVLEYRFGIDNKNKYAVKLLGDFPALS